MNTLIEKLNTKQEELATEVKKELAKPKPFAKEVRTTAESSYEKIAENYRKNKVQFETTRKLDLPEKTQSPLQESGVKKPRLLTTDLGNDNLDFNVYNKDYFENSLPDAKKETFDIVRTFNPNMNFEQFKSEFKGFKEGFNKEIPKNIFDVSDEVALANSWENFHKNLSNFGAQRYKHLIPKMEIVTKKIRLKQEILQIDQKYEKLISEATTGANVSKITELEQQKEAEIALLPSPESIDEEIKEFESLIKNVKNVLVETNAYIRLNNLERLAKQGKPAEKTKNTNEQLKKLYQERLSVIKSIKGTTVKSEKDTENGQQVTLEISGKEVSVDIDNTKLGYSINGGEFTVLSAENLKAAVEKQTTSSIESAIYKQTNAGTKGGSADLAKKSTDEGTNTSAEIFADISAPNLSSENKESAFTANEAAAKEFFETNPKLVTLLDLNTNSENFTKELQLKLQLITPKLNDDNKFGPDTVKSFQIVTDLAQKPLGKKVLKKITEGKLSPSYTDYKDKAYNFSDLSEEFGITENYAEPKDYVRKFQENKKITVDGNIGPKTFQKIIEAAIA